MGPQAVGRLQKYAVTLRSLALADLEHYTSKYIFSIYLGIYF